MSNISPSKRMEPFIIKTLKKADDNRLLRSRLWRLFSVSDEYQPTDTSALMSTAIKNLMNNGKIEIVFIKESKYVKLK